MSQSSEKLAAVPDPKEDPKPPTLPGVLMALAGLVFKREAILWLAAVVVLLGAGGLGVVWAQDKLDGGVAPLRDEMRRTDQATNVRIDAIDRKFDLSEERNARRFEVLYNAVLTGRPQPGAAALSRPLDAGP